MTGQNSFLQYSLNSFLCIPVLILLFFIFGTTNLRSEDQGVSDHHSHHDGANEHHGEHDEHHTFTPLGMFNLTDSWLDAPEIRHNTADGSPVIFPFVGLLTGYLSRDLFLDYSFLSLDHEDEHEFEIELEIPLTRRIGFFIGAPYIMIRPDGAGGGSLVSHLEADPHHAEDPHHGEDAAHGKEAGHHSNEEGWGDLFFGPRFIVSETNYSSTTFNLEVKVPTGSRRVSAGKEVHLYPSVSHWQDFGRGLTLHTQVGVDFGLKSDESELVYQAGITKTLWKNFAIVAQINGHTLLDAGKKGHHTKGHTILNGLAGLSYRFGGDLDLRSAYVFPINSNSHLDEGVRAEIIKHF